MPSSERPDRLNLTKATPVEVRLMSRVENAGNCWVFTGKHNRYGYGIVKIGGKDRQAHRISYELFVGPIGEGMVIHHKCYVRDCVNPEHLEQATRAENIMDDNSDSAGRVHRDQTHCIHGHEFTLDNTYVTASGSRTCRECQRRRDAEYRLARRES